jgi:hypothetical protein
MTEQPAEDETPPVRGIPTDPRELERWKDEFTEDLVAGECGGVGAPWRNHR